MNEKLISFFRSCIFNLAPGVVAYFATKEAWIPLIHDPVQAMLVAGLVGAIVRSYWRDLLR